MGPPSRRRGEALWHDEMHSKPRRSDAGRPSLAALARPCEGTFMECGGTDAALASGDPSEVGSMPRPRAIQSAVRGEGG